MIKRRSFLGWVLPLGLMAMWEVAGSLLGGVRMPLPSRIAVEAVAMTASGDLPAAMLQSLGRVFAGFALACALAVPLGLAMGVSRGVERNLDPLVESFRPIAAIAMLPMAILWFGTGTPAAVFIVAYAAFFPLLVNTVHGVSTVPRRLLQAARTMGVPPLRVLTRVMLPAALPAVLLGARLAMGMAWTAIIAAELAVGAKSGGGTSGGIGQMMFVFYAYSVDLNGIVVCMAVVGVVALGIDRLFRVAERRLMPWRP